MKSHLRLVGRVMARLTGALGAVLFVALLGANLYGAYGRYQLNKEFPPPGRLVSIGSHRMYIHCEGAGGPTVILDAGGGAFSIYWAAIMDRAQAITRVCAFDRSGMGWSERSSDPPSAASRESDLEALLTASGESPPFIFGGHSLGGMHAWLYAQHHLDQAAGLIAVDAVPPNMYEIMALGGPDLPPSTREKLRRFELAAIDRLGLRPVLESDQSFEGQDFPGWAIEVGRRSRFLSKGYWSEQLALRSFNVAAREVGSLGDLPLIVIRHGICGLGCKDWGEHSEDYERVWGEAQRDMSNLSTHGRLLVAENSDHAIPTRQPDMVVDAIRDLVDEYRGRR